jgi:hypothetical protein
MKMATKRIKHNPVSDFNKAVSRLGKLPQLIKYVSKNGDTTDFVIEVDVGDSFCESQRRVLTGFSSLTREERIEHFQTLALHCFMRYSGFDITEKPRDDIESKGIVVRMRGWST